jgi:hypothetical protein
METKVKLSEIIDGMDCWSEEAETYLDKRTGRVVTVMEDGMMADEFEELGEPLEDAPELPGGQLLSHSEILGDEEHFLALPSKFDIHEYAMMEDFCLSVEDEKISRLLQVAIRGSGAFRRFKDMLRELDMLDPWYKYRDGRFKEIAIEWCESNGIEYVDNLPKSSG